MSKQHIKNLYPRDEKALLSVSKCGHCSYEQLKEYVADKRLWAYEKDGLIEKETFNKFNGETLVGYKLTSVGRNLVEKEYGFSGHQVAQSLNHDLGISTRYFSISDEERATWQTETEARLRFEEEMGRLYREDIDRYREIKAMELEHKISAVDAIYTTKEGIEVGFEVTTSNYGAVEIEQKQNFVEILEISYESERV